MNADERAHSFKSDEERYCPGCHETGYDTASQWTDHTKRCAAFHRLMESRRKEQR